MSFVFHGQIPLPMAYKDYCHMPLLWFCLTMPQINSPSLLLHWHIPVNFFLFQQPPNVVHRKRLEVPLSIHLGISPHFLLWLLTLLSSEVMPDGIVEGQTFQWRNTFMSKNKWIYFILGTSLKQILSKDLIHVIQEVVCPLPHMSYSKRRGLVCLTIHKLLASLCLVLYTYWIVTGAIQLYNVGVIHPGELAQLCTNRKYTLPWIHESMY